MPEDTFLKDINQASEQKIQNCYQCLKCTSGCPVAFAMDNAPNKIVKMIQLELKQEVLSSSSIWLCTSCETCAQRCPNEINIARIMDAVREMAIKEKAKIVPRNIYVFHEKFLAGIKKRGRIYEFGLLASYKFSTLELFSDLGLGTKMLSKGKLSLSPSVIEKTQEIENIFNKCMGEVGK